MKEADVFKYRPCIDIDFDHYVFTAPIDCTKHKVSLDDAENYIVNVVEGDRRFRLELANHLRKIADKIENGDYELNGYIADYDGYPIMDDTPMYDFDWDFIGEWIEDNKRLGSII